MKIKNITNPAKFFEAIDKCEGKVEITTDEGDRLNLKSKLCQYIALTKMFTDAKIKEVEIIVSEPRDLNLILDFLIRA